MKSNVFRRFDWFENGYKKEFIHLFTIIVQNILKNVLAGCTFLSKFAFDLSSPLMKIEP